MKRDIWEAQHTCTQCNTLMKRKELLIEGTNVRSWECPHCTETVLHPEDAQRMLVLNKLKKGITVKIGMLGESLIVRFPKEVANFYNIKKGKDITLKAEDSTKIELIT